MQAINANLLRLFTRNEKVGQDVNSFLKRYQALSIIYVNALMMLFIGIWTVLPFLGYSLPSCGQIFLTYPMIALSLILLRRGQSESAAIVVLIYFHLNNIMMSNIFGMSIVSMWLTICCIPCSFLLTSSVKVLLINMCMCILENSLVALKISEIFEVTFTEEQALLIMQLKGRCLTATIFLGLISFGQKSIKTTVWKLAQENYERTLGVTKEIVEVAEAKDTFVSSLSYEIQSPLNTMRTSIESLLRIAKDSSHIQALKNIKLNAEILFNVVNNLLDIAKLKSEKIDLNYKESGSIDMIKKVIIVYAESIKVKEMSVQVSIDKNLPSVLWIDPSRTLQIMLNLFSNALKFTSHNGKINLLLSWKNSLPTSDNLIVPLKENPNGEASPLRMKQNHFNSENPISDKSSWEPQTFDEFSLAEANIRDNNLKCLKSIEPKTMERVPHRNSVLSEQKYLVWKMDGSSTMDLQQHIDNLSSFVGQQDSVAENGYLVVQISDTGCGIPENHLPTLFERFSHTNKDLPSGLKESGLGLWMCKRLCQKMGGDITVTSKADQGTTFAFYIPVMNIKLIEASRKRVTTRDKVRALVVDDYAYNRDLHKLLIEREGVQQTFLAGDGKEAVRQYQEHGNDFFDFIMLDIQMPEMDGFTAAKNIRQWEAENKWKQVDIYFVSGEYYNEDDIIAELRSKGRMGDTAGVRCLRKPLGIDMIRKIVQKYTDKQHEKNNTFEQ